MRPEGCKARLLRALASHALPGQDGDGRRHRPVEGRGLRGCREAGSLRPLRLRAPRHGAGPPGPQVPPHRIRPAQARRRRGQGFGRAGALPSRVRPVAAQPDGAPRRRGRYISPGLRRLGRGVPHPVPLVPLHLPRRRHDAARREDRGHRPAGTHRRQSASPGGSGGCKAAPSPERFWSSWPTTCGSGTPAGCCPNIDVPALLAVEREVVRAGATSGYGRPRRSAPTSPCATSWNGRPPERAAPRAGTRTGRRALRPFRQGSGGGHPRPHAARHPQLRREARPGPDIRLALDRPRGAGRADGA